MNCIRTSHNKHQESLHSQYRNYRMVNGFVLGACYNALTIPLQQNCQWQTGQWNLQTYMSKMYKRRTAYLALK